MRACVLCCVESSCVVLTGDNLTLTPQKESCGFSRQSSKVTVCLCLLCLFFLSRATANFFFALFSHVFFRRGHSQKSKPGSEQGNMAVVWAVTSSCLSALYLSSTARHCHSPCRSLLLTVAVGSSLFAASLLSLICVQFFLWVIKWLLTINQKKVLAFLMQQHTNRPTNLCFFFFFFLLGTAKRLVLRTSSMQLIISDSGFKMPAAHKSKYKCHHVKTYQTNYWKTLWWKKI